MTLLSSHAGVLPEHVVRIVKSLGRMDAICKWIWRALGPKLVESCGACFALESFEEIPCKCVQLQRQLLQCNDFIICSQSFRNAHLKISVINFG